MDVSVIICTHNRAASLERALESLRAMRAPRAYSWEIVVVDNNSADQTRRVVERFEQAGGLPLRYLFESRPGVAHARNRGLDAAAGELLVFTDDDVRVDGNWLVNFVTAFEQTGAACIGGRILPDWDRPPPSWLGVELHNQLALLDLGAERAAVSAPCLWGANIGFRRSVFDAYGPFDSRLGRQPCRLFSGEESEVIRRLLRDGAGVWYCPEVLIHHRVPAERMRKSYFRRWRYDQGFQEARTGNNAAPVAALLRTTAELVWFTVKYLAAVATAPRRAFPAQLKLVRKAGYLAGLVS